LTPRRPASPCTYPGGCPALVDGGGRCPKHRKQGYRVQDQQRGSSTQRGYGSRWQRARAAYLRRHPLCVECLQEDRVVAATIVDHIIPHRGDHRLFWDEGNWQALCAPHHDSKRGREGQEARGRVKSSGAQSL